MAGSEWTRNTSNSTVRRKVNSVVDPSPVPLSCQPGQFGRGWAPGSGAARSRAPGYVCPVWGNMDICWARLHQIPDQRNALYPDMRAGASECCDCAALPWRRHQRATCESPAPGTGVGAGTQRMWPHVRHFQSGRGVHLVRDPARECAARSARSALRPCASSAQVCLHAACPRRRPPRPTGYTGKCRELYLTELDRLRRFLNNLWCRKPVRVMRPVRIRG